ncbi:glycosyltransferase [Georgenia sp. Z1491]|uniref:glycosyltransferase n=1 Tax=Georgenia sp. Z1491 TaxID=3416707 RepID=UPI003CFB6429
MLLSLGRLAREKDIDVLLGLVGGLGSASTTLLVVGDGPDRPRLEELARRAGPAGRVVFAGSVPRREAVRYYRLSDVFVSVSRSESQGLTYSEALACGLPVVCRRDPSLDGVVTDGVNGWQLDHPADFRAALDHLADPAVHDRVSTGAAGWAVENASAADFGRRLLAIYESTGARERRGASTGPRDLARVGGRRSPALVRGRCGRP